MDVYINYNFFNGDSQLIKYFLYASFLLYGSLYANESYKIDPEHSFANWKILHVVAMTSGTVPNINGVIDIDRQNINLSKIDVEINLLGINSNHVKRDAHIKEKKFLDVESFSTVTFVSSKIESSDNQTGIITGQLTLHGISKQISMPFKIIGFGDDPWGGYRVGIEANTVILSTDYNYKWTEKNSALGNEVILEFLIEGIRR